MKKSVRWLLTGFGLCLILAGCNDRRTIDLPMKSLFTLSIGKAEDELDLLELPGVPSTYKTTLFMRDGLFFIGNGEANKVMEFSSYGDILSLLYNPESNPRPVLLTSPLSTGSLSTREAHPYPFRRVGAVVATQNKMVLVEDRVPEERQEYDAKLGAVLDGVVLRFSENGTLIDYLGQEGVGGTPFPYIERLQSDSRGDIIVITRVPKEWIVFWYSSTGELLYHVDLAVDELPLPAKDRGYQGSLESVFADPDKRLLYLKIDYYEPDGGAGGVRGNVDFAKSSVYWYNVESRQYEGHIDLPKHILEMSTGGFLDTQRVEVLYQLVGVASGGYMFLLSPLQNDYYELLIVGKNGMVVRRSRIVLDDKAIALRRFFLTPSGILCALLVHDYSAQVVWWRSDRLLAGELR